MHFDLLRIQNVVSDTRTVCLSARVHMRLCSQSHRIGFADGALWQQNSTQRAIR